MLGLHRCMDFSLVAASGGYSLFAMLRLLTVMTSLVGHGLWALGFQRCSSQAPEHRLNSYAEQS